MVAVVVRSWRMTPWSIGGGGGLTRPLSGPWSCWRKSPRRLGSSGSRSLRGDKLVNIVKTSVAYTAGLKVVSACDKPAYAGVFYGQKFAGQSSSRPHSRVAYLGGMRYKKMIASTLDACPDKVAWFI